MIHQSYERLTEMKFPAKQKKCDFFSIHYFLLIIFYGAHQALELHNSMNSFLKKTHKC